MNKIQEVLIKRFQSHRVIFWYDEKSEMSEQFEALNIDGVEKIHVQNNQFEVKYIINKQNPDSKFLLYFTEPKPANEENWLLDTELAHHVFETNPEALYLQEIGLDYYLKELVSEHIEFFKAKERRQKLKELLGSDDQHEDIRGKMLAVTFNTDYVNLTTFIHAHATAFNDGNDRLEKELDRYNLTTYYWGKIKHQFNYESENPSIYDFLLEVFNAGFVLGRSSGLSKESRIILSLWKDTIQYRESFGDLSGKISKDLEIEKALEDAATDQLIQDDLFKIVDQKIVFDLVSLVVDEAISYDKLSQMIKARENKFWYSHSSEFYQGIEAAALMIQKVREYANTRYKSFGQGVGHYAAKTYEIDQAYRKYIFHYRKSNQNRILSTLTEKVEKVYSNDWLLIYNNNWQKVVDELSVWPTDEMYSQQRFFDFHVKQYMQKGYKLFVIITDALRYECGEELSRMLLSENRYESSIDYMVSSLPSYTQLGMASLLPHKTLSFHKETDVIEADDLSTQGTKCRAKVLEVNSGVRATAITADEFMHMNSSTEGRGFAKKHDLIYIYHNRIDKTGDDKATEEKVFEAVEEELTFLLSLLKKIANVNGTHMMITSDHGFVFQHQSLDDSDYSVSAHKGEVWKENRRFVIGKGLSNDEATKHFKAPELNIRTEVDILIPKSINRIRIKGSGSRFVHGGATLQEIVIPLLKVTKKRQDTTSQVDVDIIKSTDKITTNILAVSFIQQGLVSDQMLPRSIRAAIYADDGELLSDQFKYNFDIETGSERQREVKHRFQLFGKASGKYKNQRVKLLLEEPVEGTTKWRTYKQFLYTLNISFTNDFDDF